MVASLSLLLKAAALAALLGATSASATVVFSTSFPGNAVPNGLAPSKSTGFHLAVGGGVATFSKDQASDIPGSVPRNGAASLSSDFRVTGDFDITVDLAIGTLGRVGQVGLFVSFEGGGAGLYVEGPGGESGGQSLVNYAVANGCTNSQGCGDSRLFSAGGTAWRLRIQRVGTRILVYSATAEYPQWALRRHATNPILTAPVTVSMFLQQASNSTSAHQVAFDNFLVTAGSFDSPKRSYAALGDSYSSGEGLWPYRDLGDSPLSGCHRSTRAYPTLVRWPGSATTISQSNDSIFDFIACSGAVTDNVRADGEGQNGEPPQMDPGNAIDSRRDLVTISIGGNDAQFVRIFAYCMAHPDCNKAKPFSPKSEVTLGDLAPLLVAYAGTKVVDIHARLRAAAPSANVLVLGYPILLSGKECPAAQFPPFGESEDLKLSASEQNFLRGMNRLLNEVIAASAMLSGLHFIDVEQRFTGHEVCGDLDDWVNGVVLFDPSFNPKASVHPTARGQQEYANAVNEFLVANSSSGVNAGQLASTLPRNASPAAATRRLSALLESAPAVLPGMGELRVSLAAVPAGCDRLDSLLVPGQGARLRGEAFMAHEAVSLSLVLSGVRITLGTVAADANGLLDTLVSIPIDVPTGRVLSVEALGSGTNGAGQLLINISRVETSASLDSDGDGIPDLCDNCSAKPNPDQLDTDHDGYGNVCDADFDNNGIVNTLDLAMLKAAFGQRGNDKVTDLDGNFIVNTLDLAIFKSLFGKPPGPAFKKPGSN